MRTLCLVATTALVAGCATTRPAPSPADPGAPWVDPPTQFLGGRPSKVGLLARQFLIGPGPSSTPGYAYHCYLLFADNSSETANARRGAAIAYLSLLSNVDDARAHTGLPPDRLAVLFAPVVDGATADALLRNPDVTLFLQRYNYDRARMLWLALNEAGAHLPRVVVVGRAKPLEPPEGIDPKTLSVVDLDLEDDAEIEARLQRLKTMLETNRLDQLTQPGEPLVLRLLRNFFGQVGTIGTELAALKEG